jgi:hypothetical protein
VSDAPATSSVIPEGPRPILAIGVGGFLAGLFDLVFAFVFYGTRGLSPIAILQSIASGWIGKAAQSGGLASATLGLFTHFGIALGAASVYYLLSHRLSILRRRPVPMGLLFGIGLYGFMNFVVIPLSAFPFRLSYPTRVVLPGLAVHMFFIGLPIALSVRRFAGDFRTGSPDRRLTLGS